MGHNTIDAEVVASDTWSFRATQTGDRAFGWLLKLAEDRKSGQIPGIARFLAAAYRGQAFQLDLFELRAVDISISNDMLCCLDALRCGPRQSSDVGALILATFWPAQNARAGFRRPARIPMPGLPAAAQHQCSTLAR